MEDFQEEQLSSLSIICSENSKKKKVKKSAWYWERAFWDIL